MDKSPKPSEVDALHQALPETGATALHMAASSGAVEAENGPLTFSSQNPSDFPENRWFMVGNYSRTRVCQTFPHMVLFQGQRVSANHYPRVLELRKQHRGSSSKETLSIVVAVKVFEANHHSATTPGRESPKFPIKFCSLFLGRCWNGWSRCWSLGFWV